MVIAYSMDSSIASFMSTYTDTTREECDAFAESLLKSQVSPVPIQGCFSYTVANASQLVQFRAADSTLDIKVLERAYSIHGPLIAKALPHGEMGQKKKLLVYVMEKLPGITYIEFNLASGISPSLDEHRFVRQVTLVEDFARFFATSWKAPQDMDRGTVRKRFKYDLQLLARELPSRFSSLISVLADHLDSMIDSLPGVLTHDDLSETNLLVDSVSGHLTGVIDWSDAGVLPFGCSLWGLENLLGYMNSQGWHYFDLDKELRARFWETFHATVDDHQDLGRKQEAIGFARQAGILFRYGFQWDEGIQRRVVREGGSGLKYLDALLI